MTETNKLNEQIIGALLSFQNQLMPNSSNNTDLSVIKSSIRYAMALENGLQYTRITNPENPMEIRYRHHRLYNEGHKETKLEPFPICDVKKGEIKTHIM